MGPFENSVKFADFPFAKDTNRVDSNGSGDACIRLWTYCATGSGILREKVYPLLTLVRGERS